jgi:hypothetical protein
MIKNEKTLALKKRAEQTGEAEDWAAYAEALEDHLETPHGALLYEEGISEVTKDTVKAHRAAIKSIGPVDAEDSRFLAIPIELLMDRQTEFLYAVEVRGQSSVTAHGKQGLRPLRGAVLERLDATGIPVFFAIQDGNKWRTAWMSELGPSVAISKGDDGAKADTARAGWPVSEFETVDELIFPDQYDPRPRAQERLG